MRKGQEVQVLQKKDGVLPSKPNTLYKLIRILELVPHGGEKAREKDTCQRARSPRRNKAKPCVEEIREQVED